MAGFVNQLARKATRDQCAEVISVQLPDNDRQSAWIFDPLSTEVTICVQNVKNIIAAQESTNLLFHASALLRKQFLNHRVQLIHKFEILQGGEGYLEYRRVFLYEFLEHVNLYLSDKNKKTHEEVLRQVRHIS